MTIIDCHMIISYSASQTNLANSDTDDGVIYGIAPAKRNRDRLQEGRSIDILPDFRRRNVRS